MEFAKIYACQIWKSYTCLSNMEVGDHSPICIRQVIEDLILFWGFTQLFIEIKVYLKPHFSKQMTQELENTWLRHDSGVHG